MGASARAGSRRTIRKQAAQERARRRRLQRMVLIIGLVVAVLGVGAVGAWWRASGGSDEVSGQAVYQFDTADYHSLAFDPQDSDTLYFGHHGGLMVSQDGGETWDNAQLQGVDVMQQSIPADESGRRYAAGHDVFTVSTDGGRSWETQSTNLPGLDLHGFAAAPTDSNRLYAFEMGSRGFYTSADGGTIWGTLALPPGMQSGMLPLAVGFDEPLHVFAGVGEQILESWDGGVNWTSIPGPGGMVIALTVNPDDSQMLLVGTAEGLSQRGANGNWTRLPVSPDGSVLAVAVHPENPNRIIMLDQQGKLYRSDDGGTTWGEG